MGDNISGDELTCSFPECMKKFKKKAKLIRHELIHSASKSFSCIECGNTFKRKDHLKRHSLTHIPDGKSYKCPHADCASGGFVDNYHLKRHIRCVHDSPIRCFECNMNFEKRWLLAKHRHFIHSEVPQYKCEECKEYFYTSAHYHDHIQKECLQKIAKNNFLIQSLKRKSPELSTASETQILDESNSKGSSDHATAKNAKAKKTEKVFYKCPYENCGSILSTPYNLKVHIHKHHEKQDRQHCSIEGCKATYLHKKSLKEHMKKVHSSETIVQPLKS